MLEAKLALETGDHGTCAVACRKAIYLEFERDYDIGPFKESESGSSYNALRFGVNAFPPSFARNRDYIDRNVKNPTDFIVFDRDRLNQDLLTEGVDPTAFWNLWRLTPAVYRTRDKQWIVKHDIAKLDSELLADKSSYIFSTTIDVVLRKHAGRRSVRRQNLGYYPAELARDGVTVYEKADTASRVGGVTPSGMTQIDTNFHVHGLNDDGPYWHVRLVTDDGLLGGYIHNDDVK